MSTSNAQKIEALLPAYDCCICGNATCRGLARRISVRCQAEDSCPYIREKERNLIHEIASWITPPSTTETGDRSFSEIQPCGEYQKVTVESQLPTTNGWLFDLFDMNVACKLLAEIRVFESVRCSPELGYSLAQMGESRIHLFRSGKMTVRRAEDRDHAFQTIRTLSRVLWGSTICTCGNLTLDCLGGACDTCSMGQCPTLGWKPIIEASKIPASPRTRSHEVTELRELMKYAHSIFGSDPMTAENTLKSSTREIVSSISEPSDFESLECGTILFGVQADLERISKAHHSLRDLKYQDLASLEKLASEAYSAFFNQDVTSADSIGKEALRTISKIGVKVEDPANPQVMKVLRNVFNITRATRRASQRQS